MAEEFNNNDGSDLRLMPARSTRPTSVKGNGRFRVNGFTSCLILAITLCLPLEVQAASLMIAPTRVVFEGRTRTASVQLVNRGTKTTVFRISFERKRMTETGAFEAVKKPLPGEKFADQMVRYAPRQITLPPGQSQTVRLMLRKPPNLADGEYRSHLLFREVPSETGSSIESQGNHNKSLGVRLIPVVGLSIPVIVRQGQTSASVTLDKFAIHYRTSAHKQAQLEFEAHRSGNQSVFGDFTVFHKAPGKTGKLVVAAIKGVAIYTPNPVRKFRLNLTSPSGEPLDKCVLTVVYQAPSQDGGKVIATRDFNPSSN
ncbi:MAG: fimbria/pilus periplasmic chaperone [Acidiferrobacteraceae bacterium]